MSLADRLAAETDRADGKATQAQMAAAVAEVLDRHGLTPDAIGRIRRVSLTDKRWQGMHKDEDGNAVVTDLTGGGVAISFSPSWDEGPAWPVVQPARPTTIRPGKTVRPAVVDGWQTAVILPDVQIGFRDLDGTLDPFHDEQALGVAHAIVRAVRPSLIVILGDLLDLPSFGKFEQEPSFQRTTQAALDRAHLLLAQLRADAGPECEVRVLEGNHDRRLPRAILRNAAAAFGLRQANVPEAWPVLSVPHLLRLDELGVEYVDGYPAGVTWVNERLACIHGHKYRSNGSTASLVADDERVSTIFGHVHSIESRYKTRRTRDGAKVSAAWTPGCLCRIDGAVPSARSSTDAHGRPVAAVEDWQQGLGVVTFQPGDNPFAYEQVFIHDGAAMFRGRLVRAG